MSEPEEVIIEAAHLATTAVQAAWARLSGAGAPDLDRLRRRLELLTTAVLPGAGAIAAAEPPPPPSFLARLAARRPRHLCSQAPLPTVSSDGIRLPAVLPHVPEHHQLSHFQLLAVGQAVRRVRGTWTHLPAGDDLARDLYLVAEAVAADAAVEAMLPGLAPELARAHAAARADRPSLLALTPREEEVECWIRSALGSEPAGALRRVPLPEVPEEAVAWAGRLAQRIRRLPGAYRGAAPVPFWGVAPAASGEPPRATPGAPSASRPGRTRTLRRRPRIRTALPEEDDPSPGTFMVRADKPDESVEDPAGLSRPEDGGDRVSPDDLADSLADLECARLVVTPDAPREVLAGTEPLPRQPAPMEQPSAAGIVYPEWDCNTGQYRARGAVVRERVSLDVEDARWRDPAGTGRPLANRIRREFERLRPRREWLRRQEDGEEIDLDAYVAACADVRAGGQPDGRLYRRERKRRQGTATLVLVDASDSTDAWLAGSRRVIDVAREAVTLVDAGLAALGDPYAVLAFRSFGPGRVDMLSLKDFGDDGGRVGYQAAALEPAGYTRTGAAIRHASFRLAQVPAHLRILLLVSDGRPNDVDVYEGRYGLEDTRRAIQEARLQGIVPFCCTIDRQAPAYAAHVFGAGGYTMVRRPEQLPFAVVSWLRAALRR